MLLLRKVKSSQPCKGTGCHSSPCHAHPASFKWQRYWGCKSARCPHVSGLKRGSVFLSQRQVGRYIISVKGGQLDSIEDWGLCFWGFDKLLFFALSLRRFSRLGSFDRSIGIRSSVWKDWNLESDFGKFLGGVIWILEMSFLFLNWLTTKVSICILAKRARYWGGGNGIKGTVYDRPYRAKENNPNSKWKSKFRI